MTDHSKPAVSGVPLDWLKPTAAEQSMLGQLLEDLRIDGRTEGTDGRTKEDGNENIGENLAHAAGEHKPGLTVPSRSDPLPGCCSRRSS